MVVGSQNGVNIVIEGISANAMEREIQVFFKIEIELEQLLVLRICRVVGVELTVDDVEEC